MIDETWEMNMHHNPIDEETEYVLKKHQNLILKNTDEFVTYIHLSEKARKTAIKQRVYHEKLKDFAVIDQDENLMAETSRLDSRPKSNFKSSKRVGHQHPGPQVCVKHNRVEDIEHSNF